MLGNQPPQTTPQQRRNKLGLIIFIVLFFLLTIHDEDDTKTSSSSSDINKNLPASILKQRLEHQLLNNYNLYPHNLTGYFTGNWSFGTNTSIASSTSSINTTNINTTNIGVVIGVPTSVTDSIEQESTNVLDGFTQSKGVFLFRITKAATSIQTSSIIEIQGSLRIVDGTDLNDWTLKAWSATCRGLYFPGTGKLTMFTNSWGYNLYLREQHIPGRSGDIDIYNDTLIVLADQDTEEKDDADGDDSNNKNNNIGNVTTLPVSSSLSSSLSQQKKKKSKSSCIARVDMDVSISSHPEQHVTNAATTLSDATDLTNTNQVAAFTLSSTTSSALSPATPLPSLSYDGTITTPLNCHLDVSIRTHVSGAYINFNTLYDTGHIYGLLACINTGIQILTHLNLLKQSSRNSILTQSMSPISFLFISCIDAIECLLHFCIAILFDELFSWFIIIGILKLVLFSIMELKFLFKIFSSRNIMSTLVDRGRLNARFYCSLLFLTALLYRSFSILKILLFLLASGIVIPQLIDNAWQDISKPILLFQYKYYYCITQMTRLFLPIYIWIHQNTLLQLFPLQNVNSLLILSSDPLYVIVLLGWSGLQLWLLSTTVTRSNARWYVPKRFLPKMFDYRRDVPEEMKNDGDLELGNEDLPTCAICFMTVDTMTEQYQDRTYMLTPCNHLYHAECLTTWFVSGHLNCPVCRSSCPPEGRRDVLDGEMVVPAG